MAWYDPFLDVISKFKPVQVHVHFDQTNNIEKLQLGDSIEYKVENGFIHIGTNKIKIEKNKEGIHFILPDGTKFSRLIENKEKNLIYLDKDKKVFTRSDISGLQIPFLSIEKKHEIIIKILKPYLENYRRNLDLGALLVASTIIRLEDGKEDKELIDKYYIRLHGFKKEGHMIYNLFRSGIVEREIIPLLQKIIKAYKTHEETKRQFLIYWYDIIAEGYPTAYFVKESDHSGDIYKELNWRFDRGEKKVTVYSRGSLRNSRIQTCLQKIEKKGNVKLKYHNPYRIGFSRAIKIDVIKALNL